MYNTGFFSNKSEDLIYYLKNTLVGHAEMMYNVSAPAIQNYGSSLIRHVYNVLEFNQLENKSLASIGYFFKIQIWKYNFFKSKLMWRTWRPQYSGKSLMWKISKYF